MEEDKKRTILQNKSIHLFCDKLGTELNSKGYDMRIILKPEYKLRWDMGSVKENLYKPIAKALYGVESTTELTTAQVSKVHEQLMLMLVEKFPEIDFIDFPSLESTEEYIKSFSK